MSRLDHDCVWAAAKAICEMVAPALRDEEIVELHGMVVAALEGMLLKRDELLARERRRLCKPSEN